MNLFGVYLGLFCLGELARLLAETRPVRPRLFYLLDYRISSLQKPKSGEEKSSVLSFFSPSLILVANKKKISTDHIGRAYKSAIPRGRLKCSAVLLLET
jgi:hypothetical protein